MEEFNRNIVRKIEVVSEFRDYFNFSHKVYMELLPYIFIFAGWISFLAFLYLPVYESDSLFGVFPTEMRGFLLIFGSLFVFFGDFIGVLIAGISALLNLSFILSPLIFYNEFIWIGKVYFVFASILSIISTIILVVKEESSRFYWTFYLWSLSFVLIGIGLNLL